MRAGYCSITAEVSRKCTDFKTEYGKYEFLEVISGIHVVQSYFNMMINETLKGLDFYFTNLNDLIIHLNS